MEIYAKDSPNQIIYLWQKKGNEKVETYCISSI